MNHAMQHLVARLRSQRGDALIEGVLALGLVLLTVVLAAQAIAYVHTRSVAIAAAQDGARTAATAGPNAGIARASVVLEAAGGAGRNLHATIAEDTAVITVSIDGEAPRLFALPLLLPDVHASASLPREAYPEDEAAP